MSPPRPDPHDPSFCCAICRKSFTPVLGNALYSSWRTLIQIGVASWRNIWKSPLNAQEKIATFKATWIYSSAFCSFTDKTEWNFIPPAEFLPREMTTRPSLTTRQQEIPIFHSTPTPSNRNRNRNETINGTPINPAADLVAANHEWEYDDESSASTASDNTTYSQLRRREAAIQADNILRLILQDLELDHNDPTTNDHRSERSFDNPAYTSPTTVDLELQLTFNNIYRDLEGD